MPDRSDRFFFRVLRKSDRVSLMRLTNRFPMKPILESKPFWFVLLLCPWVWPSFAVAQIIPDRTLPNHSIINSQENLITIDGGTAAGNNLFHSFSDFSVNTGTEVLFNNAVNIQNILTRVTGNNLSNIDGLIRANGAANLFLINPNGLIFGNNARLAIGGSFFGSTANSVLFPDGEFPANVGEVSEAPLLSVNVPIGLQMAANSATISVNGTGITDIIPTDNLGLTVAPGQTFALIGNGINFNGGIVTAPSGRIEIGSVANGTVGIIPTPIGLVFNYDLVNEFANINLANRSAIFSPAVVNNPLSQITVTGKNIGLDRSQIVSLTNGDANSGNITINAAESLSLGGTVAAFPFSAWIVNQVAPNATGNSGDIEVKSANLSINNGARIQTLTQGAGAAGNIQVEAAESMIVAGFALPPGFNLGEINLGAMDIDPETWLEQNTNSRISSENFASGSGGNISVSTKQATFLSGGQIATLAGSQATGNSGNINAIAQGINAENSLPFNPLVPSGIATYTSGQSAGGELNISTEKLTLSDGAFLVSWTQGSGKGGDILVNATDAIASRGVNPLFPVADSGITSIALGSGNGGNIQVSTAKIDLSEGAQISSRTLIELVGVSVPEGGTGNAGNIIINADTIELTGISPLALDHITLIGSLTFGSADAGDVNISTRQMRILQGAQILNVGLFSTSTLGEPLPGSGTGNGGNLTVNASESIEIYGFSSLVPNIVSLIGNQSFGLGLAGDLLINTPRLILQDGGSVAARTVGAGNAGNSTINASEIFISGKASLGIPSSLSADAFAGAEDIQQAFFAAPIPTGNTGELTVNSDRLTIANGGQIRVDHQGTGNAGRLQINVDRLNLESGGNINATTAFGFGGNVEINVRDLLSLRNGSQINVEAKGDIGDGGNLTINADLIVALENSDIIANAVGGNGGNINITSRGIFGSEFRPSLTPKSDITASSELGVDGTVEINNPDANPAAGLVELPSALVDPSNQITSGCVANQDNEFYIVGRGGLPQSPIEMLWGQTVWQDLRWLAIEGKSQTNRGDSRKRVSSRNPLSQRTQVSSSPIVEATGWVVNADGSVKLVGSANEFLRFREADPLRESPNCGDL